MKQPLKLLAFFFFLVLFSCSNGSIDQLQQDVLIDIEAKLADRGQDIQVKSFVLTHVSGNEYVGVLETLENGENFTYNVNVISDGNSFVWEIPTSELSQDESTDMESNTEDEYASESYDESNTYEEEDHKNMTEAMENISDPTYCSLCKGTGVEKNTAKEIFGGPDGRICPMCEGTGRRSY